MHYCRTFRSAEHDNGNDPKPRMLLDLFQDIEATFGWHVQVQHNKSWIMNVQDILCNQSGKKIHQLHAILKKFELAFEATFFEGGT